MSFVYSAMYLALSLVIAFALVKPLHAVINKGYHTPTTRQLLEAVGSWIVLAQMYSMFITLILWLLAGTFLSQLASQAFPSLAPRLSWWHLPLVTFGVVWAAVTTTIALHSLRIETNPNRLAEWNSSIRGMIANMEVERKVRSVAAPPRRTTRSRKRRGSRPPTADKL